MDIIEQSRDFSEVAIFRQITVFYEKPYVIKEHKNDEMFLSKMLLKHASPPGRVLYILLDTFDFLMQ